jgi:hypothetical protein
MATLTLWAFGDFFRERRASWPMTGRFCPEDELGPGLPGFPGARGALDMCNIVFSESGYKG